MSELSPAARSVFESFNSKFEWLDDGVPGPQFEAIAAALRAAADHVVPEHFISDQSDSLDRFDAGAECRNQEIRDNLLAIADELEAQ